MNVGDYVRTKHGLISKYVGFEKDKEDKAFNKYKFDSKIYWYYEYYNEYVYEEDFKEWYEEVVVKSKPNIIDLIEVGDYVNGLRVNEKTPEDKRKKQQICVDAPYMEYGEDWLKEDEIKSIVTKECFESMEYKVKE